MTRYTNSHIYLRLIADEQIIFHGVGNVANTELQCSTFRYPGKPKTCPHSRSARLMLPDVHHTALRT